MIWEERNLQVQKQDSIKAERLRSKNLYKIFLILVKYTPMFLALIDILHTTLAYFEINNYFLNYIGGVSLTFLGILYVISYLFQFCYLYRLPLHYITATNVVSLYDSHIGIPITDIQMFRVYLILAGITLVIFVYKTVENNAKHHKKSTTEVYQRY